MQRIALVLCVISALLAGVAATLHAVTPRSSLVSTRLGPWRYSALVGAPEADPYTRARLFLSGEMPVASGQGYTLRAYEDSDGHMLDRRCTYRLASPLPAARFFTLTLTDSVGRLVPNLVERASFTSSEIVRQAGGGFEIVVGPDPLPGNWLPTGGLAGAFLLDLRLYDTPLSAAATRLMRENLPRIEKNGCRA